MDFQRSTNPKQAKPALNFNPKPGQIIKDENGDRWIMLKPGTWERLIDTFPSCKPQKSQCLGAAQNYQVYETHNNGGRPFEVIVTTSKIFIFDSDRNHILTLTNYKDIFIGFDPGVVDGEGNSILVQVSESEYIFIGHKIFQFEIPNDTVLYYFSPIGNNDVPYPYLVTQTGKIYLMLDRVKISNSTSIKLLSTYEDESENDPYTTYYENEKIGTKFKYKLIADSSGGLFEQWKSAIQNL